MTQKHRGRFLGRVKIGTRLLVGFSILLALLVLMGYQGDRNMQSMHGLVQTFNEEILPSMDNLLQADRDLHQLLVAERSMLVDGVSDQDLKEFQTQFNENGQQALDRFNVYADLAQSDEERELIAGFRAAWDVWKPLADKVVADRLQGSAAGLDQALALSMGQANAAFEAMREYINQITEIKQRRAEESRKAALDMENRLRRNLILLTALAVVGGLLMCVLLTRSITVPVKKAMRYAGSIAEGDFAAELVVRGTDEIGLLAQAMRTIPDTLTEMKSEFDHVVEELSTGRLTMRGDASRFRGQYAELIGGVNKLADTLVGFWDVVPMPIIAIDRGYNVLYMNKAGHSVTDTAGKDLATSTCHKLMRTGDCNTDRCACARAMRDGADVTSDTSARPAAGEMEIHYTATPIRNAAGEVVGAFEIVTDQTAIKRAQAKMLRIASQANDISERMASASEELAAQVEQISQGAEMQSSRMAETATAMDQMNASVLEVARNSGDASSNAERTRTRADEGAEIVAQSVRAIEQVQAATGELGRNMQKLAEQAETIGSVMNVITDIADQTNLLALNAAIEAARAGDAGRGFAVVADEVRKLAEKTMSATGEVGRSIQAIQQATRENMQGMDRAAEAVGRATTLVQDSGKALREIVEFMGVNARQVEGIATAAEEQSATSEQINRAVEEVNRIVSETTDGMRQSSQAVQELAVMSGELRELIAELQA